MIENIRKLYIFDTSDPYFPTPIGDIEVVRGSDVVFRYNESWISNGFPLSGDLPLSGVPVYSSGVMFGAINDAMPDRWGEYMMCIVFGSNLGVLDKLFYAGDMRFGCLGFSLHEDEYRPFDSPAVSSFSKLNDLVLILDDIDHVSDLDEQQKMLISSTRSMGGAHKKALVGTSGDIIVKLPEGGYVDVPLIEHATLKLASMCGINTVKSQSIPLICGHAIAIERFDRKDNKKLHCLSSKTAILNGLNKDIYSQGGIFSYASIADIVRLTGWPELRNEVFRRMIFNIMMDNTDDHENNHAFILNDNKWSLSPCYDILPLMSGIRYHQMSIGVLGFEGSKYNALSECERFGLNKNEAEHLWDDIERVVVDWRQVFSSEGVTDNDISSLSEFILNGKTSPLSIGFC